MPLVECSMVREVISASASVMVVVTVTVEKVVWDGKPRMAVGVEFEFNFDKKISSLPL